MNFLREVGSTRVSTLVSSCSLSLPSWSLMTVLATSCSVREKPVVRPPRYLSLTSHWPHTEGENVRRDTHSKTRLTCADHGVQRTVGLELVMRPAQELITHGEA